MTEPELGLLTMGPDQPNNCRGWLYLMQSGDMQTAPTYAMATAALSPLSHSVFAASLDM